LNEVACVEGSSQPGRILEVAASFVFKEQSVSTELVVEVRRKS